MIPTAGLLGISSWWFIFSGPPYTAFDVGNGPYRTICGMSVVSGQGKGLVVLLRGLSLINFAAIVAVVVPRSWLAQCHEHLGLGTFPDAPIAVYLARSTSLWFAAFGVLLWSLSRDVARHDWLIGFIGWAMGFQGLAMIIIDCNEGLPVWWIVAEGPSCLLLGISLLTLRHRVNSKNTTG